MSILTKILLIGLIKSTDCLLDIGTGLGLLAFGAYGILKEKGMVIASDNSRNCLYECSLKAVEKKITKNFKTLLLDATDINLKNNCIDVIVGRSVLLHIPDKQKVFNDFYKILKPGGRISFFEPIFKELPKITDFLTSRDITNYDKFKRAEQKIFADYNNAHLNFDENTLKQNLNNAGFCGVNIEIIKDKHEAILTKEIINNYYFTRLLPNTLTMEENFSKYVFKEEVEMFLNEVALKLQKKKMIHEVKTVYITAKKK